MTDVWVVTYVHRHGHDTWVASSEERALAYVRQAIEEWADEVPDDSVIPQIRDLARRDVREAMAEWREVMPDEDFYIDKIKVDGGL